MSAANEGVLAVMDDDRRVLVAIGRLSAIPTVVADHDEARAAVAELVEAAKDAMDCDTIQAWSATKGERRQELLARYECAPGMRPVNETKARLRAALARCGGAK